MKGNHNQQKRHGRSLHARLFSLLLAVVTAVTMIPSTAFAAPADGVENGVTGGAADGAANSALSAGEPVIRIAWTPEAESAAAGEQVAVLLEASAENLPGADVSIELTDAEAGALKAWMETEAAEGITLTENEQSGADENDPARDGEFSLQFSLNEEQPSLEKEIALSVPAEDQKAVVIGLYQTTDAAREPAAVEKDGKPWTVEVTEASQWKGIFEDLPKYDAAEKEIQYSVKEESVGGEDPAEKFETTYGADEDAGSLTVTNKLLPKPAAGPDDKTEPTSDQPAKTGDTTDITLAAALVMISLAGGVTVILMRRNRKKTK